MTAGVCEEKNSGISKSSIPLNSMLRSGVASFVTGVHAVHEGALMDKVGREALASGDGDVVVAGMSISCWSW